MIFPAGIAGTKPGRETRGMINVLFTQPNYMAAKTGLDLVGLRQRAIQDNLANLETPGYKRMDVVPSFTSALERAAASHKPEKPRRNLPPSRASSIVGFIVRSGMKSGCPGRTAKTTRNTTRNTGSIWRFPHSALRSFCGRIRNHRLPLLRPEFRGRCGHQRFLPALHHRLRSLLSSAGNCGRMHARRNSEPGRAGRMSCTNLRIPPGKRACNRPPLIVGFSRACPFQ